MRFSVSAVEEDDLRIGSYTAICKHKGWPLQFPVNRMAWDGCSVAWCGGGRRAKNQKKREGSIFRPFYKRTKFCRKFSISIFAEKDQIQRVLKGKYNKKVKTT